MSLYTSANIIAARDRLGTARERASQLMRDLTDALHTAAAYTDPDLSPDALARQRTLKARAAREQYGRDLATLRTQLTDDAAAVTAWAESKRPQVEPDRVRLAWERVRLQLDAGIDPRHVIASTSDVADLAAMREMGPAWLNARAATAHGRLAVGEAYEPADAAPLLHAVDVRLGEVAGIESAMNDLTTTAATLAAVTPTLDYAEYMASGGNPDSGRALEAAVASSMADKAARNTPAPAGAAA